MMALIGFKSNSYLSLVNTLIIFLPFLSNCGKNQKIIDAENTTLNFFGYISEGDEKSMKKYYPNISTFGSYYKSDSIKVNESKFINDSLISVSVTNYFTNGFGKKTLKKIKLYLYPDSLRIYSKIIDSKGLTDHSENELYSFAVNTGCMKDIDTTDVQMNIKYLGASLLSRVYVMRMLSNFKSNVSVIDWSWETGYSDSGSASGKGIVKNNTTFDIPDVKYEIKYKDRRGNVITSDDGYVTYDVLGARESKLFTFYTSYVGDRTSLASIALEFDEDMIKKYVLKADYNGDEYDTYMSDKEQQDE